MFEKGRKSLVQIIQYYLCFLVDFVTFSMNPNITVITLDAIVAFSYRSIIDFTGVFHDHLSGKY